MIIWTTVLETVWSDWTTIENKKDASMQGFCIWNKTKKKKVFVHIAYFKPSPCNKSKRIREHGDQQEHTLFELKSGGIYPAGKRLRQRWAPILRVFKTTFPSFQENALNICSCFHVQKFVCLKAFSLPLRREKIFPIWIYLVNCVFQDTWWKVILHYVPL